MIPSHNTDGNRRTGRAHQPAELRPWLGYGSGAGAQPASLFTVTSHMLAQQVLTDGVRFSSARYFGPAGRIFRTNFWPGVINAEDMAYAKHLGIDVSGPIIGRV
jgi:hypothetical protein